MIPYRAELLDLDPYQITGAEWLAGKSQALLADFMGIGKSAEAVRACDLVNARSILVICPGNARVNWQREFQRFSPMDRSCHAVMPGEKVRAASVMIMSYEMATAAADELKQRRYDVLILDEAHYLKERGAKRTKAIYGARSNAPGILSNADRTWRLTGTPAPNDASELWTHMKSAGLAKEPYWDWVFRYTTGFESSFGYKITGVKNEAELRSRMEPFMLRRMAGVDLPPLCFETVAVERSSELLSAYFSEEQSVAANDEQLRRALGQPRQDALKILESTATSYSTLRRYTVAAKLPAIAEILEQNFEVGMDKIVLFAIHTQAIEWLAERLKRFNPVTLYGKTPANKKQEVVDRFQSDPSCRALIGNIQAAGVAITLTAGCEVGFIEKSWVPADNLQALKRCHRRSQTRGVHVRSFTLYDSSDELVDEALTRKIKELAKIL
jgi:SWI/SNF-related matrix-associated actin-dependent regulator 1 of chromatin subfamily A